MKKPLTNSGKPLTQCEIRKLIYFNARNLFRRLQPAVYPEFPDYESLPEDLKNNLVELAGYITMSTVKTLKKSGVLTIVQVSELANSIAQHKKSPCHLCTQTYLAVLYDSHVLELHQLFTGLPTQIQEHLPETLADLNTEAILREVEDYFAEFFKPERSDENETV